MKNFNYKAFLKEGGVEKYLLEENFGNDIESRYAYIRPLMVNLADTARTEAMIDGMEDAKAEDDKMAFDFYFVETMKMLGLESELMEVEDLGENDEVLDRFAGSDPKSGSTIQGRGFERRSGNKDIGGYKIGDEVILRGGSTVTDVLKVVDMRRMFGSDLTAYTVEFPDGHVAEYDETQLSLNPHSTSPNLEEVEGEVQNENKILKASNDLEDALNDVADDLTDEQIDNFTNMILDLRDKVKAQLKKK